MKQTLTIKSPEIAARAQEIIGNLPLDPVHEVLIRPAKKDRSLEANGLLWKWNTIIGADLGWDKEEVHAHYKQKFLPGIYLTPIEEEDGEFEEAFREIWATLDQLKMEGEEKEASALSKLVVSMLSTARLGVKRMSMFMNAVSLDAGRLGIRLPHPDDRGR